MTYSLQPLLDFAVETAYLAGRMTLGYFRTGVRPDMKPNNTPVTKADKLSEELIRSRIKEYYPDHAMLGEEYGQEGSASATFRWILDPIDGTKQFIRGIGYYSVLIGLEIDAKTEVGVAYFPAVDEMYCAASGLGCWWNGKRIRVSNVNSLKDGWILFEAANFSQFGQAWNTVKQSTYHQLGWGDAYAYMLVASGRAELVLDNGMEIWDCGPLAPILNEAGGYFGDWDGHPLNYGKQVMATTRDLLPQVLELTRQIQQTY